MELFGSVPSLGFCDSMEFASGSGSLQWGRSSWANPSWRSCLAPMEVFGSARKKGCRIGEMAGWKTIERALDPRAPECWQFWKTVTARSGRVQSAIIPEDSVAWKKPLCDATAHPTAFRARASLPFFRTGRGRYGWAGWAGFADGRQQDAAPIQSVDLWS